MSRVTCRCGETISVKSDEGAERVDCPKCGRGSGFDGSRPSRSRRCPTGQRVGRRLYPVLLPVRPPAEGPGDGRATGGEVPGLRTDGPGARGERGECGRPAGGSIPNAHTEDLDAHDIARLEEWTLRHIGRSPEAANGPDATPMGVPHIRVGPRRSARHRPRRRWSRSRPAWRLPPLRQARPHQRHRLPRVRCRRPAPISVREAISEEEPASAPPGGIAMSTVDERSPASTTTAVPPLVDGQRLRQAEFMRRYELTPPGFTAELIGGVVHVASPLSVPHGRGSSASPPGSECIPGAPPAPTGLDNATTLMDGLGVPQPDSQLRILPECGGQSRDEGEYVAGGRNWWPRPLDPAGRSTLAGNATITGSGVREYIVVALDGREVHWHVRRDDKLCASTLIPTGSIAPSFSRASGSTRWRC